MRRCSSGARAGDVGRVYGVWPLALFALVNGALVGGARGHAARRPARRRRDDSSVGRPRAPAYALAPTLPRRPRGCGTACAFRASSNAWPPAAAGRRALGTSRNMSLRAEKKSSELRRGVLHGPEAIGASVLRAPPFFAGGSARRDRGGASSDPRESRERERARELCRRGAVSVAGRSCTFCNVENERAPAVVLTVNGRRPRSYTTRSGRPRQPTRRSARTPARSTLWDSGVAGRRPAATRAARAQIAQS